MTAKNASRASAPSFLLNSVSLSRGRKSYIGCQIEEVDSRVILSGEAVDYLSHLFGGWDGLGGLRARYFRFQGAWSCHGAFVWGTNRDCCAVAGHGRFAHG